MIRTNLLILIGLIVMFSSCNKIDNYEAPNGDIYGKLTDKITNQPLQTEQPNGFIVKLFEKGGSDNSPIIFPGKSDGSFENALIFQKEYRVSPTEGAFFPVNEVTINVGSRTEVNFDVIPFLAVQNVSVNVSSGKITSSYKISRSQLGDKIVERKTLVSSIPTVNKVVFDFKAENDLSGISDADILAAQYTDEVSGLTSGKIYYVRIAVRTDNSLKKYNYSEVYKVTIP